MLALALRVSKWRQFQLSNNCIAFAIFLKAQSFVFIYQSLQNTALQEKSIHGQVKARLGRSPQSANWNMKCIFLLFFYLGTL